MVNAMRLCFLGALLLFTLTSCQRSAGLRISFPYTGELSTSCLQEAMMDHFSEISIVKEGHPIQYFAVRLKQNPFPEWIRFGVALRESESKKEVFAGLSYDPYHLKDLPEVEQKALFEKMKPHIALLKSLPAKLQLKCHLKIEDDRKEQVCSGPACES